MPLRLLKRIVQSPVTRLWQFVCLLIGAAVIIGLFIGDIHIAISHPADSSFLYLPLILKPVTNLKSLVTQTALTLPVSLGPDVSSWCTWSWCSISPRLYHEPLGDGRTLVGWTDSNGVGHVSVINNAGTAIQATYNFSTYSLRGLAAHVDNSFAVLLWNASAKQMWLSKRASDGSQLWITRVDGPLTVFDPGIGDSRLSYGNGNYIVYFAVYGVKDWVQGHNGDQLTYVNDSGVVQPGGWEWGCSHSMAELASYHPALDKFLPVCSSDCYATKGILLNDNQSVFAGDGNCGGNVSTQLGQVAVGATTWKLVFSALDRPASDAHGIALATINGSFGSSYLWLTNTNGDYEREPVIARLGSSLSTDRYLVGWMTTNDGVYRLAVVNGNGVFLMGPEEMSSAGILWGDRDDSLRTRADGRVSWIQGDANSTTLRYYRFDGTSFLP